MNDEKYQIFDKCYCSRLMMGLAACDQKGPAEKAGEKIDEAVEYLSDSTKNAAAKVGDQLEEISEEIKKKTQSSN